MPAMISYDAAYLSELAEETSYELWTLEFFRAKFFKQTECANSLYSFKVGEDARPGVPKTHVDISFSCGIGDSAVDGALGQFRPLAFISSFKLQDMIVGWILNANGIPAGWRFKQKIADYEHLRAAGTLHLPDLFVIKPQIEAVAWQLYKKF